MLDKDRIGENSVNATYTRTFTAVIRQIGK